MPVVGYWHAWQWYFNRIHNALEEAIGLFAILAFIVILAVQFIAKGRVIFRFPLWPIALLLTLYSLSFLLPVPSIVRAAVAFLTLFMIIYWASFGKHPPVSFWALIAICLPVVPSLQFYLGYPARIISASLTVPLLQLNGVPVARSGTNLVWQGQLLQFDAPCSGVTMLWAGLLITLFVCLVYRFSLLKTAVAIVIALLIVLIGNVLRASSLFYLETGALSFEQPWMHDGIGIAAFLLIAAGILMTLTKLQQWSSAR
jgi:exosortase/archaeosortase family protein